MNLSKDPERERVKNRLLANAIPHTINKLIKREIRIRERVERGMRPVLGGARIG